MLVTRKTVYDFGALEFTIEDKIFDDYDKLSVSGGYLIDAPRDVMGDEVSVIRAYINDIMEACNNALTELDRSVAEVAGGLR